MFKAAIIVLICISFTSLIVFCTFNQSAVIFGFNSLILCAIVAFSIQWIVFIPSYLMQTEKYYDLAGTFSFVLITLIALFSAPKINMYNLLIALMVIVWALRLGTFLFARIKETGKDDRFEQLKNTKYTFLIAWTLQGLWVFVTSSPALVVLTSSDHSKFSALVLSGILLWLIGFSIEVIADHQKIRFKKANNRQFINSGLWKYSRHPNYFGEILLWIGLTITVLPAINSWQYVVLVSPLFVTILLTKISGIPMLENKADKIWGDDKNYQTYKTTTSTLILWFKHK